jgi:uroporphyrinogen decarboxylase
MMTPRERVLAAINHKEPDRVPIDCGGMRSAGIAAIAYAKLKKHLGINDGEVKIYDVLQQLAYPEEFMFERFKLDAVDLGRVFLDKPEDWFEWTLKDGSPAKMPKFFKYEIQPEGEVNTFWKSGIPLGRMPKSSYYFDQIYWPLGNLDEIPDPIPESVGEMMWDIPTPPWDMDLTDENLQYIASKAKELYETTDYAIMTPVGCNFLEIGMMWRGMENFFCDIAGDPIGAERLFERLMELHMAKLERILPYIGPYVQILHLNDDYGSQNGPMISPEVYRKMIKPRQKKVNDFIKSKSNCKLLLHCCGGIHELIPDLIEAGFDILNPVQTSCKDMEPERLKNEFGKDITFWGGGCDTRDVLPNATPDEIEMHVKERLEVFAPGGGFVFNTVHNIMANVPPENIVRMYETVIKYGVYK